MGENLKILILELRYPHQASYYNDWGDAFVQAPFFIETRHNLFNLAPKQLAGLIDEFDLIILLHSCTADTTNELSQFAQVIGNRKCPRLIAFVGNEYNSPYAPMSEKIAVLKTCRPDAIATQLLPEAGRFLYAETGAHIVSIPHALNPKAFQPGLPDTERSIDIGVRSFTYSPILGDQERNRIIEHFRRTGRSYGLRIDIDDQQRFDRRGWAGFLRSCRGTVSSEAGSYYLDKDDSLVRLMKPYIDNRRSTLTLDDSVPGRRIVRNLPIRIKIILGWLLRHGPIKYAAFEDQKLNFEDLYERFFRNAPKCPAYSKAISSRHFDAIGTRTCQILIRGRYNDILTMGDHYVPVAPDLSDISEAIEQFKDPEERNRITNCAYEHVMENHTYLHRMNTIYEVAHDIRSSYLR